MYSVSRVLTHITHNSAESCVHTFLKQTNKKRFVRGIKMKLFDVIVCERKIMLSDAFRRCRVHYSPCMFSIM